MTKRRVLYFSIGTFAPTPYVLGGNIYGKNLVQRLAQDDRIELFVVNANEATQQRETTAFFDALHTPLLFVPLRPSGYRPASRSVLDVVRLRWKTRFRFPYELEAHNQDHVADAAASALRLWKIDYMIVDFLLATLFWKGIHRVHLPKALVTVNREADLYADILSLGLYVHTGLSARISHWRLSRYEKRMYRSFDKVVAIGSPDVPRGLPASRTAVITSYLDENPIPWRYDGTKTVFFVGNIGHYPNRLAIDYLVTKVAPRVLARDPSVKFAIIGASKEDVEPRYHHENICMMGVSTPLEVEKLFRRAALFLCPIQNTFGMKFKVAEAISYGTPFLASTQTMLGFPYLRGMPQMSLDDPDGWAAKIVDLLTDGKRLEALSESIRQQQRAFAASQKNVWSRTLFAG